ncbi:MAG: aldehyde dehydrogenase family protein [Pirellulales bacterium]
MARKIKLGDGPAMKVADGVKGFTHREPWGVVAGIIPWNYPIVLTSWFMFPALLSGNTILIKPAEDTPLSALYIAKLAQEAGFPAGVINVLPGRGEITGHAIAEHPGVRYISFTGSPGVGQAILRTCDRHGTRMKRELGGNGAAIVLADADPELVARMVGKYTNQHYGQTCCTIHRVFVDKKIADDFIDAQTQFFKELKIGYQADEGTQLGAVINATQRRRILQAEQETVARGAEALLSGGDAAVSGKNGFYLKPSLYRTNPALTVNPVEVFHTYATICPVSSAEEAIAAGQQFAVRFGLERLDQRHRARRCAGQAIPRRHRSGQLPQLHRLRTSLRRPRNFRRTRRRRELRGNFPRLHAGQGGVRRRLPELGGRRADSIHAGGEETISTRPLPCFPFGASRLSENIRHAVVAESVVHR